jgi:hypothetical protein
MQLVSQIVPYHMTHNAGGLLGLVGAEQQQTFRPSPAAADDADAASSCLKQQATMVAKPGSSCQQA